MATTEAHVIIVGGVSVNDVRHHDRSPFNFLNAGARKAKTYSAGGVRVILYTTSYEIRALNQEKESPLVDRNKLDMWVNPAFGGGQRVRDTQYFIKIMETAATGIGFTLTKISSAGDLSEVLQRCLHIETLDYFGHSNQDFFFLDYSSDGRGLALVKWGLDDARKVSPSVFDPSATFSSFGCHQGDAAGLAEKLRAEWKIKTIGSEGNTDFESVVGSEWCPATAGHWFTYPAPTRDPDGTEHLPPRELLASPR
jgi:hypothetical protein